MLDPFMLPFVQEGIFEILLLSVATGLVGTWVVLRGLAFYSHAIGTASFPGLVLADGLGFSAGVGAFGMAAVFTAVSALVARSRRTAADSVTALALVACLAAGVILASDVFDSGANVDTLLFGSLLAIGAGDQLLAGAAAVFAILATRLFSDRWLARGFDQDSATSLKAGSAWLDLALLAVVAFTVTAALSAVGALLVTALIVVPAATVRLVTHRVQTMQLGSVALVATEGVIGLWLSVKTDAPPGATIAVVSGAAFGLVLFARHFRRARPIAMILTVIGLCLAVTGCGSGSADGNGRLKVVATTTQVADLVSEVGGERVDLTGILQPNTDPHDYEPRPSDVVAVADAAIVFRSGGDLDPWTGELASDSDSEAALVNLGDGLPVTIVEGDDHGHGHDEDHAETDDHGHEEGGQDPHWWLDPVNARAAATEIASALSEIDPDGGPLYDRNLTAYDSELGTLDRSITRCFRSIPPERRRIVTDHDSFAYFGNRYGIELVGSVIPALTTEAQPSAGDLADLEDAISGLGVVAVFPGSSSPKAVIEAIAADTGVGTGNVLYGDSLGDAESPASTYIGMMKENARSVKRGLTGGREGCHFES